MNSLVLVPTAVRAWAYLHEGAASHVEHELWKVRQVLVQQEAGWVILAVLSKPAATQTQHSRMSPSLAGPPLHRHKYATHINATH
jgi:hypothetical protein